MTRLGALALIGAALVTVVGRPSPARADAVVVAFGDSLTAGYGVAPDEAYPARLQTRLTREGYAYRVVNAGVSGDTTAGALRRVDWVLRAKPEVVIVALGANDGLRGQSVKAMQKNLVAIVGRLQAAGARVLVAGMRLPPNYGDELGRAFAAAFPEVARATGAAFMPFLLNGVAALPRLNQPDGIHPNARGHRIIAEQLWPYLKPLLRPRAAGARADLRVTKRRHYDAKARQAMLQVAWVPSNQSLRVWHPVCIEQAPCIRIHCLAPWRRGSTKSHTSCAEVAGADV